MDRTNKDSSFISDDFFNTRDPEREAEEKKKCVLKEDEIEWLKQSCLVSLSNRFAYLFFPVVHKHHTLDDLRQKSWTYFQAALNSYRPHLLSKNKGSFFEYKRLPKGLMSDDYSEKMLNKRDKMRENLRKGFEWHFWKFANCRLADAKQRVRNASKRGGGSFDYDLASIEEALTKNHVPHSPEKEAVLESLYSLIGRKPKEKVVGGKIVTEKFRDVLARSKNKNFIEFFMSLARRTKPAGLMKKYGRARYEKYLHRADELQYEIATALELEVWNNDAYFDLLEDK